MAMLLERAAGQIIKYKFKHFGFAEVVQDMNVLSPFYHFVFIPRVYTRWYKWGIHNVFQLNLNG